MRCDARPSPGAVVYEPISASQSLSDLTAEVARAVERDPSTDALWAAALLELWSGAASPKAIDRAIDRLSAVAARATNSSLAAHHLSIAHLARAAVRQDPGSLYAALEWSERAHLVDSTDRAISLTRAIILSNLGAALFARDELLMVQMLETERGWSEEISARVAEISQRTVRDSWSFYKGGQLHDRDLQRAREAVFDSLLPVWLEGDSATRTHVADDATLLGIRLMGARGDSSVWQMARELRELDLPAGANALRALLKGVSSYKINQLEQARIELANGVLLMESRNAVALAAWGRVLLGATHLSVPSFAEAENELRHAIETADATGSLSLRGRALWALGLVHSRQNKVLAARASFEGARDIFLQLGEYANAGDVSASLSQIHYVTGMQAAAVRTGYDALTLCQLSGDMPRAAQHIAVAEQLRRIGLLHAAHAMNFAAVRRAEETQRPFDLAEALSWMTNTQAELGRVEEARRNILRARELLRKVADPRANARISADLDRAETNVEALDDVRGAIAALDRARSYFWSIPLERAPILLQRGELLLSMGDSVAGTGDLEQALLIADSMVAAADARSRRALLTTQRQVRRRLAAVALAKADTARALQHSLAASGLRSAGEARASVTPTVHVIALDDQVLSWLWNGDDVTLMVTPVGRDSLGALAHRFSALVRTGVDPVSEREVGALLYRMLLGGHVEGLGTLNQLDVSVDAMLADVPVAALPMDDSTLLVDRIAVRMRVSAMQSRRPRRGVKNVRPGPLVIRNPEWSVEQFPDLERLRFADQEGNAVLAAYPDASLLGGAAATREAVQREITAHGVVHFAGHARVNADVPDASHLVLSSASDADEGRLFASDLARMDLRNVRVAVLSSCGRPALSSRSLDAADGLTLALLDAGAVSVVSGLWEVDDEVASLLMVRFHEALRAGAAPHAALQHSQRALLAMRGVSRGSVFAFTTHERALW